MPKSIQITAYKLICAVHSDSLIWRVCVRVHCSIYYAQHNVRTTMLCNLYTTIASKWQCKFNWYIQLILCLFVWFCPKKVCIQTKKPRWWSIEDRNRYHPSWFSGFHWLCHENANAMQLLAIINFRSYRISLQFN